MLMFWFTIPCRGIAWPYKTLLTPLFWVLLIYVCSLHDYLHRAEPFITSQKIHCLCGTHRLISLPLVPTLSQMNQIHILQPFPCGSVGLLSGLFKLANENLLHIYHLPFLCCMFYPSNLLWLDRYNIWGGIQIMELFLMHLSPASNHFMHSRPKYSPKHLVFKHPQSVFFP